MGLYAQGVFKSLWKSLNIRFPEAEVIRGCEPPKVGSGTQFRFFQALFYLALSICF